MTVLDGLRRCASWNAALATGAWQEAAALKLRSAGLDVTGLVMASCDDAPDRAGIVRTALARAAARAGREPGRIVLIGDGRWDVRTAERLELPFIGVAEDGHGHHLQEEGAAHVMAEYRLGELLELLGRAERPARGRS